jgi:hypothetical protein
LSILKIGVSCSRSPSGQGRCFAAGDLGLELKEYSKQPGEENKSIYRKNIVSFHKYVNKLEYKIIYHVAACWRFCLHRRGWAQCKARWRTNRQQDGAAALKKSVNIAATKTWEMNIVHAG